jgi:hypothetical protein
VNKSVPQEDPATTVVYNPQPRFHRPYLSNPEKGPLIVVGIDGTLAPLRLPTDDSWGDWAPLPGAQVSVPFSLGLGAALRDLPGEVVFCSDWGTRSDLFTDAYNWGDVWSLRRQSPSRWWWKLEAVRMFLGSRPRRPVVWFDDEFHRFPEASSWSTRSAFPVLLIETDPRSGIQPDMIKEAEAFCKANASYHVDAVAQAASKSLAAMLFQGSQDSNTEPATSDDVTPPDFL